MILEIDERIEGRKMKRTKNQIWFLNHIWFWKNLRRNYDEFTTAHKNRVEAILESRVYLWLEDLNLVKDNLTWQAKLSR